MFRDLDCDMFMMVLPGGFVRWVVCGSSHKGFVRMSCEVIWISNYLGWFCQLGLLVGCGVWE